MAEEKKNDKVMKTGGGKNRQLPKIPNKVNKTKGFSKVFTHKF